MVCRPHCASCSIKTRIRCLHLLMVETPSLYGGTVLASIVADGTPTPRPFEIVIPIGFCA